MRGISTSSSFSPGFIYFARPYHSCKRGLNKDTNVLLRQYMDKGKSLLEIDPERLRRAVELMNHRPRTALV